MNFFNWAKLYAEQPLFGMEFKKEGKRFKKRYKKVV